MPRRFTEQDVMDMARLRLDENLPYYEIAERYDTSAAYVSNILLCRAKYTRHIIPLTMREKLRQVGRADRNGKS